MIPRHACVLLFVLMAMSAGLAAQQGRLVTETEPNNAFTAANLIQLHDTVSANIDYNGDADFYAVDLPAGTKLFVILDPASHCWGFRLYDRDQTAVLFQRVCHEEHADTLHTVIQTTGRYFLSMRNDDDAPGERVDPAIPYKLTVGIYTPPPPGSGNPTRLVATDEWGVRAMVAAPNGDMILSEDRIANDRVQTRLRRMTPGGQFSTFADDIGASGQMAVDAFGDLLVPTGEGVWRYSLATGTRTLFTGPSTGAFPYNGITIGADGDVWLADPGSAAGAVFSRFDAFGNFKEKIPITVGRVFNLTTAQDGELFFQTQGSGDVYRLVNNTTPVRVIAAHGAYDPYQGVVLDRDGWVYLSQPARGKLVVYNPQYQIGQDPLAQVLDSMFWASKYVGVGPAWMRDANGVMTSRMLVGRGPLVRAEQQLRDHEILEVNQRGMGAPGADPFFHVIAGGVRAGAQTVVYLDTLRTSESGSASWSVMSGKLPPGIALASNGVLSGTPTSTGTFDFIAKAAARSRAGFGRFSITVTAAPAVVV